MKVNNKFASPNYSVREQEIDMIIIHYAEISFEDALSILCDPAVAVSAHYLIKNNGEIYSLVEDKHIAWHAGLSYWQGREKLNQNSIGIELDNDGWTDFSKQQMNSCINLCKHLQHLYNINQSQIIGHSDVALDRKIDPGIFFDWRLMARNGLGLYHDCDISALKNPQILFKFGDSNMMITELQKNLHKLGYKMQITNIFDTQTNYAVRAFQAHFYPELLHELGIKNYWQQDTKYFWDEISQKILVNLISKLSG